MRCDQRTPIRVSVDAVDDAAWALGRSLYDPIELHTPSVAPPDSVYAVEVRERVRLVELRLIARLIALGRQDDSPLTVRQLMKIAPAAGFERDSGCPRQPESIPLYARRPNGPVAAMVHACVTGERKVAVLMAEANPALTRHERGPKPVTKLVGELLAWPTRDAAAECLRPTAR